MEEKFSLKDFLFNKNKLLLISVPIKNNYKKFKNNEFTNEILKEFPKLELKQRINLITEKLRDFLPQDYKKAVSIILKSLPEQSDENLTDDDFGDFIYAPYSEFIVRYLDEEHLDFALEAIKEVTKRFSAEFAIRTLLIKYKKQTLIKINNWTKDSNYHVRRLCSEGTRPRLPWGKNIDLSANDSIKILDKLYFDSTRYVVRSVANHLNDLSKINPELVINTLKKWKKENKSLDFEYLIKHSTRTLIKNGDEKALNLLGLTKKLNLKLINFKLEKNKIKINEYLDFSFSVESFKKHKGNLAVTIFFNKSNNKQSPKIFKILSYNLKEKEALFIRKKIMFKHFTTRRLYPGKHKLELNVNGITIYSAEFLLN